jgi:hypothetical protein
MVSLTALQPIIVVLPQVYTIPGTKYASFFTESKKVKLAARNAVAAIPAVNIWLQLITCFHPGFEPCVFTFYCKIPLCGTVIFPAGRNWFLKAAINLFFRQICVF